MKNMLFLVLGVLLLTSQSVNSQVRTRLIYPADNAVLDINAYNQFNVELRWSASHNSYAFTPIGTHVYYSNNIKFAIDSVSWTDSAYHYITPGNQDVDTVCRVIVDKPDTYYWYVKMFWRDNIQGGGVYSRSDTFSFTFRAPVGIISKNADLKINPQFILNGHMYYDLLGRSVKAYALPHLYIQKTDNTVSKEVIWNCSRKTSR